MLALFFGQESSQRYNVRIDLLLGHWCNRSPIRRHHRSGSLKVQGKGNETIMALLLVNVTVTTSGESRRGKGMIKDVDVEWPCLIGEDWVTDDERFSEGKRNGPKDGSEEQGRGTVTLMCVDQS